jgi:glycosyltransferase involved in cell wall biosynthesis
VDTQFSLDDQNGLAIVDLPRGEAATRRVEHRRASAPLSMRRHVVMLAPPWYPVPPDGYGGIEIMASLLTEELRARGHLVTLFAAAGSKHPAVVHAPAVWNADLGRRDERLRELTYGARILESLRHRGAIDVVHDHVGYGTLLAAAQLSETPVVHTVHGSLTEPESTFYAALAGRVGLVAISESQRRSAPNLPWIGTVLNAVALHHLTVGSSDRTSPYLVCLARICPDKGQHIAIEVARRTGLRLILAGKVEATPASRAYYATHVLPSVDGDRVVHLPNVAGSDKATLLDGATALLAPIQWDEPFGLSVVEAMAIGTPAISFARGAARELIDDGLTGFLVRDADEMVAAVGRVTEIEPAHCAALTRRRFSPAAMADGYLRMYERAESSAAPASGQATARLAT